jgi:hypothetical protein
MCNYGLDTVQFADRKWSKTIMWSGESKGKLLQGMAVWENAVGVTFSKTSGSADFDVKWGSSGWNNRSKGNGKPASGKEATLSLKTSSCLGSVLHEIGHLLGLSHAQDHPDNREAYYETYSRYDWELDGAKKRASYNKKYGNYDPDSIMHYPKGHYRQMTAPSDGDVETVKAINGW